MVIFTHTWIPQSIKLQCDCINTLQIRTLHVFTPRPRYVESRPRYFGPRPRYVGPRTWYVGPCPRYVGTRHSGIAEQEIQVSLHEEKAQNHLSRVIFSATTIAYHSICQITPVANSNRS